MSDGIGGGDAPRRPGAGRRIGPVVVLLVLLALVAIAAVIADSTARSWAEGYVSDRIEGSFPAGVDGTVETSIGGFSVIQQYLTGRFDEVRLTSDDLSVDGAPVTAQVDLTGVPVDQGEEIRAVHGRIVLGEEAVQSLLEQQGQTGTVAVRPGAVDYSDSTEVLGFEVGYTATAVATLIDGTVLLTPQTARLTAGSLDIDAGRLISIVAPDGYRFCLAEALPEGIAISSLSLGDGAITADLTARDLPFSSAVLESRGSCG